MYLTGPRTLRRCPDRHAAVAGILASQPFVPEEVELVLRCHLIRDANGRLPCQVRERERLLRAIRLVVGAPDARVLVVPQQQSLAVVRFLPPGTATRVEP